MPKRKLILQMNITTDGFVAGLDGQLDWMLPPADDSHLQLLRDLTGRMDMIIMGRGMAEGFTSYWENVVDNQPENPEYPYAKIFVDTPKIVFSRTVKAVRGRNVMVENDNLVDSINKLKKLPGKDIIVYGGANFVSSLIEHRLIDDLYLFINPVAIGNGLSIFSGKVNLKVIKSTLFSNSVIANHYQLG